MADTIPVRKLRRAVRGAPEVMVQVHLTGEAGEVALLRVSKREVYKAISRIRKRSKTIRAADVFGALVIG